MSKSIKGTQTEKNLLTSFAGESQARMRYTYFASVAKKEGYEQISAIFTETADQEKEHAKRMFKFLEGGMVEITASYPAGVIGTTLENLPMLPSKKVFPQSLLCTVTLPLLKKDTKNVTALSYRTLRMLLFSLKKVK